jgi:hypothetical protein
MKIIKIGDSYINLENITHADFETTPQGLTCAVFFNCQVTDGNGCNGVQASKTFTAAAAQALKAYLELRTKPMERDS